MPARHVTDGGLETDLMFLRGFDLPEFASFPLLDTDAGRAALRDYYLTYADIAVRAGAPLLLETPTWRANADHAALLGYDAAGLDRVNRESVAFLASVAAERADELVGWEVGGMLGRAATATRAPARSTRTPRLTTTARSSPPSRRRARSGRPC